MNRNRSFDTYEKNNIDKEIDILIDKRRKIILCIFTQYILTSFSKANIPEENIHLCYFLYFPKAKIQVRLLIFLIEYIILKVQLVDSLAHKKQCQTHCCQQIMLFYVFFLINYSSRYSFANLSYVSFAYEKINIIYLLFDYAVCSMLNVLEQMIEKKNWIENISRMIYGYNYIIILYEYIKSWKIILVFCVCVC